MDYISVKQLSEKWGLSTRRIQILCRDGRVPGAMRIASTWVIPADAKKPKDARIKSGRYIKCEEKRFTARENLPVDATRAEAK